MPSPAPPVGLSRTPLCYTATKGVIPVGVGGQWGPPGACSCTRVQCHSGGFVPMRRLCCVSLWDSAWPRCQMRAPRGDSRVIIFPMSTTTYPRPLCARPWRHKCESDQLCPGSGTRLHTQRTGLGAERRKAGSSPTGPGSPRRKEGREVSSLLPSPQPRLGEGTAGSSAAEWPSGSWESPGLKVRPPPLLADAVHVCPARSSPPHPEHFP